jgi:type IV secretory pathway VirB4 component
MGSVTFYTPSDLAYSIGTTTLYVIAFIFVLYKLTRFLQPFIVKPILEKRIADVIPFFALEKNYILKLKNSDFVSVIELMGLDYTSLSEQEIENITISRHTLFKDLGTQGCKFKIFTSKSKQGYQFSLKEHKSRLLNDIFKKVHKNASKSYELKYYIFIYSKTEVNLKNTTERFISVFHDFKPTLLKNNRLLNFLWFLINHNNTEVLYAEKDLHYELSNTAHSFDGKSIHLENQKSSFYCNAFSINTYAHEVNSNFLNQIIAMNCKLEVLILANIFENNTALASLSTWERFTIKNSNTRKEQFYGIKEDINSQQESLIDTQLQILLYAETQEELEINKSELFKIANSMSINILEENKGSEISYFNRYMGFDKMLRPRPITSSNLTHLIDFKATDKGLNGSDWGKNPLAYFKNYDGSLHKLYLHVNDEEGNTAVAHTVSFAPTGSGKTFLFQHIMAGALYFYDDVKIYAFDSNNGLKVFTQSVEGNYLDIKSGNISFNPLLIDLNDDENKLFLASWFEMISGCSDDESLKAIEKAIKMLPKHPEEERKLTSLLSKLFQKDSTIYKALEKFANGIHKDLFNGDTDNISLTESRINVFDMTNILGDEKVCTAVLSYIMYNIRKEAKKNAKPHLVFIDETSAMLKSEAFKEYIKILLKEHRKLRGSINLVFQNIDDIKEIEETVLSQCQTRFIFKNKMADNNLYQNLLKLNDAQMDMVYGLGLAKNLKRPLIVQKLDRVALLEIDLREELQELTKFYNSSIDHVNQLKELKRTSDNWYEDYKNTNVKEVSDA